MTTESIKKDVKKLYDSGAIIHVAVSMNRPKINKEGVQAKIVGAYPHIFQIEECSAEKQRYTFQYTDILIGQVRIAELN